MCHPLADLSLLSSTQKQLRVIKKSETPTIVVSGQEYVDNEMWLALDGARFLCEVASFVTLF